MWHYTGRGRPPFAHPAEPGQESVWDYPRPPRFERDRREVIIAADAIELARSTRALRVLETASPPTFYLPRADIADDALEPAEGVSYCEWKGRAVYWSVRTPHRVLARVAWSYPAPHPAFDDLRGYVGFYPSPLECFVGGERVRPQPGRFYAGWITSEVVGPYKGEPGTEGW